MPTFNWDVLLPGEDLPRRLTTDYLVTAGEEVSIDGAPWIVDRVEIDSEIEEATGVVSVVSPSEPVSPPQP